jgi:hypothetical protein
MTAQHLLQHYKEVSDELVLEDYDLMQTEQSNETSPYQHCITLLKTMIKCFQHESLPTIKAMASKVQHLKFSKDRYSQQIVANILEIILVLPHIYDASLLPIEEVCSVISAAYEANRFNYLARIIRKYHSHLPTNTVRGCFEILARVVATPISGAITAETIYQSALGLKTLMAEMEAENVPISVLAACISNIVNLIRTK